MMLTIGEFSTLCKVPTKTLRYYAEIGLLKPSQINPKNGYRYYSIDQLEKISLINRLKLYSFSLKEIKTILDSEEPQQKNLYSTFLHKKKEIEKHIHQYNQLLNQLEKDLLAIDQGQSSVAFIEPIEVDLVEMPSLNLLSIRKMVQKEDYPTEYHKCYGKLFKKIAVDKLTMSGSPMILFHKAEYLPEGLDTEFAIPIEERIPETRNFSPGLCLKTIVRGPHFKLSSVYAKQREWAAQKAYQNTEALFEIYKTDPSKIEDLNNNITEVYYPVKKIGSSELSKNSIITDSNILK